LKVVKKERDELRTKIINIEKLFQEKNTMIRRWMDNINCQSMSPNFEKTEDENEILPPSQPFDSCQGNFIILCFFL